MSKSSCLNAGNLGNWLVVGIGILGPTYSICGLMSPTGDMCANACKSQLSGLWADVSRANTKRIKTSWDWRGCWRSEIKECYILKAGYGFKLVARDTVRPWCWNWRRGIVGGALGRLALSSFVSTALSSIKVGEVGRPLLFFGRKCHLSEIQGKRKGKVTSI